MLFFFPLINNFEQVMKVKKKRKDVFSVFKLAFVHVLSQETSYTIPHKSSHGFVGQDELGTDLYTDRLGIGGRLTNNET